jgi:hypothetical protein
MKTRGEITEDLTNDVQRLSQSFSIQRIRAVGTSSIELGILISHVEGAVPGFIHSS